MKADARIDFANSLRGFAALAVVISHYYGIFWLNRTAVSSLINAPELSLDTYPVPSWIAWLHVISIFNWGAYGVALFFIVSGFVIPFSINKGSWLSFALGRIFRIMPTYFFGFTISLLALFVSSSYFSKEFPFSLREVIIHYIPGIRDVLWSRGIDGIVWTLEIEMKFYVICAASIAWFRQQSLKVFLVPIALSILAFFVNRMLPVLANMDVTAYRLGMVYMTASQYIIYMYIGVIFNFLWCGKIRVDRAYLGVGLLFMIFCLHWWAGPYSASLGVAWSYAFGILTFAFAYSFSDFFKSNFVFDFMANISYPLYVVHGVAGYVAIRLLLDMGWGEGVSIVIVTAVVLFCSWIIHVGIEEPTKKLGKRAVARWSRAVL
jgi:peptidoglycan/LPS O-acetylase OafA/YrhL